MKWLLALDLMENVYNNFIKLNLISQLLEKCFGGGLPIGIIALNKDKQKN